MSKLAEYRQLERHLAEQMSAFEAMKGDEGLAQEIEFEQKLQTLLTEYNKSLRDIISIIDPQVKLRLGKSSITPVKGTRRPRVVKVYKNPHTDEVIETKGGNHKLLKEWKSEHGNAEVESWLA